MWDLFQFNGIEYVLPFTDEYTIDVEKRIKPLRSIDKRITDVMPIVVNCGPGAKSNDSNVLVQLSYNYKMISAYNPDQ